MEFTFHYASTISQAGAARTLTDPIYIPLCFYFIRIGKTSSAIWIKFTFHYASTLSQQGVNRSISCLWFTFHYASTLSWKRYNRSGDYIDLHSTMLLLYLWTAISHRWTMPIYIPLCFYFIRYGKEWSRWFCLYLHSTMLLLYRNREHSEGKKKNIYIPLCFYFIPAKSYPTFGDLHLHSTMLLLYPGFNRLDRSSCGIYIPLCFYFIQLLLMCWGNWHIFTFHYASTLSIGFQEFVLNFFNLHSTMLLLYPV